MNGEVNCILGVCCPEGSEAQVDALALEMEKGLPELDAEYLHACARWVLENFDLAEKGTLTKIKASIARLARQPAHKPDVHPGAGSKQD